MSKRNDVHGTERGRMTRRTVLKAGAGGAVTALAMPAVWRRAHGAQRLVIADPGGPYSPAFKAAFHQPFTKETGVEIVAVARTSAPTAQVKAMVETKAYQWDAVYVANPESYILGQDGLLEPIDTSGPDFAELPKDMVSKFYALTDVVAVNLAYNKEMFGKNPPRTWADFWNVAKFPGRRSLGKRGYDTTEMAIMADGVPGPQVYKAMAAPDGWDRIFRKMDEIRPHTKAWWTSGTQNAQIMKSGEADLIGGYAARHQSAIDDGAPFDQSWDQGFYYTGGFVIPKGNPNADLARRFCAFTANAERQAACAPFLASGPANPNAMKYIDPKRASVFPTHPNNFKNLFAVDVEFWQNRKAKANEKMTEWFLKG